MSESTEKFRPKGAGEQGGSTSYQEVRLEKRVVARRNITKP